MIEFLESRAGDSLRVVGRYNGETCTLEYVREDLPREEIRDRVDALRANITWSWNPPGHPTVEKLGTKQASLQVRKKAVILHLPLGEERGVLIGLEPEASRNLTTFITDCMSHVDGLNPPA